VALIVEFTTIDDAQRLVAAYLAVLETHAESDVYPCSIGDLPQSKDVIRAAFRRCVTSLAFAGQLGSDMSAYLEVAYVSLADYVTDECVALLTEYGRAGEDLATDRRLAREKLDTDAWRRLTEQSRLAGQVAREITADADRLREEFRAWRSETAPAVP
jgi:hypothetical protein